VSLRPRLGVVTVTYNSGGVIGPFLACLAQQDGVAFQLVAVDNASNDDTVEQLRAAADPRIVVIANRDNRGFAEGTNQGIEWCKRAGTDWILLINNDTEFDPTFLSTLIGSAQQLRARVLAPTIVYHDRPELTWFAGGRFSWWRGFQARHDREGAPRLAGDKPRTIAFAPGCCLLVHHSVFESVGMFDPAYFVYWEDVDFCWRLNQLGIDVYYDPRIDLKHKVSALTKGPQGPFSVRHYSRNQVYFLRKHFAAPIVSLNLGMIRLKNRVRRWTGLDDSVVAGLRREAIAEGLRMPIVPAS
jgi:GT2 family glycosyltransferase